MLDQDFRRIYNSLKLGKEEDESRVDVCYAYTSKILSNLLGALFIRKRFSPETKSDVRAEYSLTYCKRCFHDNNFFPDIKSVVRRKILNLLGASFLTKIRVSPYTKPDVQNKI